jgi:hypothetical protein
VACEKDGTPCSAGEAAATGEPLFLYFNLGNSVLVALFALFFTPSIAMQTINQCGQPVRIYLRKEAIGEQETVKPLSRTIIGSTQTMLLLENRDEQAYGVMPLDIVREIIPRGPSGQDPVLRVICAVFQ